MSNNKIYENHILITNSAELKQWANGVRRFQSTPKNYKFDLQGLTSEDNQNISNAVNHYNNACGCKTGGLLMSLTFCGTILFFFITDGALSTVTLGQLLWLIGLAIAGALMGKAIGILWSKWKLIQLSNELLNTIKPN